MTRILIVDDDPVVAASLAEVLGGAGYECITAGDGAEALEVLGDAQRRVELLITELDLPGMGGRELLKALRDGHGDVVPLVLTGFGKIEDAVAAIKLGAADYLTKPVLEDELKLAVEKAAQTQALLAENVSMRAQLDERFGVGSMIGADYRMQQVFDVIESVADSTTAVLVTGEAGVGKAQVAHAIHQLSSRGAGAFVTFTIDGRPESLLEEELFGGGGGGGSDREKQELSVGRLREAQGGTLLSRGIAEASLGFQERLLRVLQERRAEGGADGRVRSVNARFVFSSGLDLAERVESGAFRRDLFYRINVVPIVVPALRERAGDVGLLAEHFVEKYASALGRARRLSVEAVEVLSGYGWPGNVRELEGAMERAVVLSAQREIGVADLPEAVRGLFGAAAVGRGWSCEGGMVNVPALADGWTPTALSEAMCEPERQILLAALEANDWNRSETARQLEIDRTTLYKKIKRYGLDMPG